MKKNKKILILPFLLTLLLFVFFDNTAEAAINNKPGDIIVTKSTSGSGITGHTGIYIDTTHILHTSGWSSEPYPKVLTETQWHDRYAHSKVIRPNSSTLGADAADMAKKYFQGKTIPYSITPDPTDIKKTYCSELVWYSYYKAGKTFKVYTNVLGSWTYVQPKGYMLPYDFIDSDNVSYNKFSFIDNTW